MGSDPLRTFIVEGIFLHIFLDNGALFFQHLACHLRLDDGNALPQGGDDKAGFSGREGLGNEKLLRLIQHIDNPNGHIGDKLAHRFKRTSQDAVVVEGAVVEFGRELVEQFRLMATAHFVLEQPRTFNGQGGLGGYHLQKAHMFAVVGIRLVGLHANHAHHTAIGQQRHPQPCARHSLGNLVNIYRGFFLV